MIYFLCMLVLANIAATIFFAGTTAGAIKQLLRAEAEKQRTIRNTLVVAANKIMEEGKEDES